MQSQFSPNVQPGGGNAAKFVIGEQNEPPSHLRLLNMAQE